MSILRLRELITGSIYWAWNEKLPHALGFGPSPRMKLSCRRSLILPMQLSSQRQRPMRFGITLHGNNSHTNKWFPLNAWRMTHISRIVSCHTADTSRYSLKVFRRMMYSVRTLLYMHHFFSSSVRAIAFSWRRLAWCVIGSPRSRRLLRLIH